jgi:hypothetical protein
MLLPLLRFSFPRSRTLPATRALMMKNKTLPDCGMRTAMTTSGPVQHFYQQAASTLAFQLLTIGKDLPFVKGAMISI